MVLKLDLLGGLSLDYWSLLLSTLLQSLSKEDVVFFGQYTDVVFLLL